MKMKHSLFIACMLLTTICGFAKNKVVKGNGKIITKEIPITDYDAISLISSGDFEYVQSDAAPYLKITVDENILSVISIKIKGRTLEIEPKQIDSDSRYEESYSIRPTRLKFQSNSRKLKNLSSIGSGNFTVNSPLNATRLNISLVGSGNMKFDKLLTCSKADFNMSGSGNLYINNIKVETLKCSVAGSGSIQVKGEADRASYSLAASGDIKAFGCKSQKVECSVVGSGSVNVYATEQLDASVVGSGNIHYKGDPSSVSKNQVGSGSIKKD